MENLGLALQSAWKVLAAGLVLGAGLPAIFAMGVRSLAYGTGDDTASHGQTHPLGKVLAALCFGVVVAAVLMGITYVVASGLGKTLGFEHVYPTIVDKKK